MTKEQEVEQAWKDHTNKRFDEINQGIKGAIRDQYQLTAIKDFKSALKREIEKRIDKYKKDLPDLHVDDQITVQLLIHENKLLLKLLETVKP